MVSRLGFCLIVAIGILAGSAWAQSAPSSAAGAEQNRGFFWEARKGNQRVYLMGTIHVGRAGFIPPREEIVRRLQETEVIVVEADVSSAQKVLPVLQKIAFYPEGEAGLESRLDERMKKRVVTVLARQGLDPARFWRMKPWMLGNTLVILEASRFGMSPAYGTEAYLFRLAEEARKPIAEIESLERQMALFEAVSATAQLAYLEQVLKGIESGESERELDRLAGAWTKGDEPDLERLYAKMRATGGRAERWVVETLIDGRNPAMADAAERYAASGKLHVIAVGSMHYVGPKGVLALLRSRGWTIKGI